MTATKWPEIIKIIILHGIIIFVECGLLEMKKRRAAAVAVGLSICMQRTLLKLIDERAARLGFHRSQYFAQLARRDISNGRDFTVKQKPKHKPKRKSK